jgi:Holliday junction resolvasome RuvABC endonuclease subunit
MVKLLLGLDVIPRPHDAADALAVAICHLHSGMPMRRAIVKGAIATVAKSVAAPKRWRDYRPSK